MVGEILQQKRGDSRVKGGVSIGMKTVFVSNVNQIIKFMTLENAKHLNGVVFNKHFQGLVVDKVRKQRQIGLGSRVQ